MFERGEGINPFTAWVALYGIQGRLSIISNPKLAVL